MLIEVALNGNRSRKEHAAVPQSPAELAAAARDAVAAGASAVHMHVYNSAGVESLDAADVATTTEAVRAAIPKTQFGISTGAWIVNNIALRLEKVMAWGFLIPYVSINFNEEGAVDLARWVVSQGIGIEAGMGTEAAAKQFTRAGLANQCVRAMFEPEHPDLKEALAEVDKMDATLARVWITTPRLLHGHNTTVWPMVRAAKTRGWQTRIGLEDTLLLPDGSPARDNAALVAAAKKIAQE
ncbi:MAG: 3-keto-5-aminohexanoate cleavage protein [Candidatus Acidiferrales bacterium]